MNKYVLDFKTSWFADYDGRRKPQPLSVELR